MTDEKIARQDDKTRRDETRQVNQKQGKIGQDKKYPDKIFTGQDRIAARKTASRQDSHKARHVTRQDTPTTRQSKTRHDTTRHDMTWHGTTRHDKTKQETNPLKRQKPDVEHRSTTGMGLGWARDIAKIMDRLT
jgi:hypothetical protein